MATVKTTAKKPKSKTATKNTNEIKQNKSDNMHSSLTIIKEYKIGVVELSETQAIEISIIINAELKSFVYIRRIYRTKIDDEWKQGKSGGIWLPFTEMHNICDVLIHAYDEGLKMGLDNIYKPAGTIYHSKKDKTGSFENFSNSIDIDCELWTAVLEVGLVKMKKVKTTSEWKKQMVSSCGSEIEFLLPAILKIIELYPAKMQFDEELISIILKCVADNFKDGITDFSGIFKEISEIAILKNKKDIKEMTKAVYDGMRAFFDVNKQYTLPETKANELKLMLDNEVLQTKLF